MLTNEQLRRLRRGAVDGKNRVRIAMRLAGVTQVQMAQQLNLTQPHISRIVCGDYSDLPLETARKVADYFKCPIEDLFPSLNAEVA